MALPRIIEALEAIALLPDLPQDLEQLVNKLLNDLKIEGDRVKF